MDWTSYDQIPWDQWNPRGTGQHNTAVIDMIIAHNRGDRDYTGSGAPSVSSSRLTGYGASESPTMGIQPGGLGSIPGASHPYNQLMAISRARNDAIADFGGWDAWTAAGSPQSIFADLNLPDMTELRQAASQLENYGQPPAGYLQSEEYLNSPNALQQRGWNYDEDTGFSRAPIPQGQTYGDQPYVPMPGQYGYRASQAGPQTGPQTGGNQTAPLNDSSGYLNMPGATGGGTAQARVSPLNMPVFDSPSDWFQPGSQLGTTGLQRGFNPFGTGNLGQFSTPMNMQAAQAAALRG
jgi:hypothetical protein